MDSASVCDTEGMEPITQSASGGPTCRTKKGWELRSVVSPTRVQRPVKGVSQPRIASLVEDGHQARG